MKHIYWDSTDRYMFVKNRQLYLSDKPNAYVTLNDYEIMGEWVEVK